MEPRDARVLAVPVLPARDGRRERRKGTGKKEKDEGWGKDKERPDGGELEEELAAREDQPARPGATLRAGQVFTAGARVLLWGQAGTGKSTLLRWLACQAAGTERIPVWINRLENPQADLADQLAGQALEVVGLPGAGGAARQQLREAITSGKADLFLDALDEAPLGARMSLAGNVARLLGPEARAIISSRRIHEQSSEDTAFTSVYLRGLGAMGPELFLHAYHGKASWVGKLLRELRSLVKGDQWLRTPILLTLAAALYRRNQRLPDATLDLYRDTVESLLVQTAEKLRLRNALAAAASDDGVIAMEQTLSLLSVATPSGDLDEVVLLLDALRDGVRTKKQGSRLVTIAQKLQALPLSVAAAAQLSNIIHRLDLSLGPQR